MRNPSVVRLAVVLGLLLLVVNLVPMAQDPTPNPFMSMCYLSRQHGLLEEEAEPGEHPTARIHRMAGGAKPARLGRRDPPKLRAG